ncbi:Uma2 family endonuclease [Crinalium epipsammum]|nr:Uma2 family endonuclease [Crinalium epipsammum]
MSITMSVRSPLPNLTVKEYLDGELVSDIRHEYIAGQVFAMAGASANHNLIAGNMYSRLRSHLRGSKCSTFMSDMKVRIQTADIFYYPDVLVSCDPKDTDDYCKTQPCLIIEVVSRSTATIDLREKLLNYRQIESLKEYILISQDRIKIEVYRQDDQGQWWLETLGKEDELQLESVGLRIVWRKYMRM